MPVLCLIADPTRSPLRAAPVERVAAALGGRPRWLSDDAAVEIAFAEAGRDAQALALNALGDGAFDVAVLDDARRQKRLFLSDMDSTMITIECIDELAGVAGIKPEIAAITERAMRGEIDFFAALRARVGLLAGLDADAVREVIERRLRFMPGAKTLVRTMRANGARTVLVSGGFTAFTSFVREALGFDADHGNVLEIEDDRLTGQLVGPLLGADAKRETLRAELAAAGLPAAAALAVGDGANDEAMLEAAGLGVAFRAHEAAEAAADVAIRHGDLTALLYLQGYDEAAFVRG